MLKITGLLLSVLLFILPTVRCSIQGQEGRSEKNEDKSSSYSEKSDNTDEKNDKESSNTKTEKDIKIEQNKINHWLPTIKKTEPKDSEGLVYIFDEGITLPVDFSKVEGEGEYYDEIRESVALDYMITDSYEFSSDDDIYMPRVWFENYTDKKISVAQCYKNNWWWLDLAFYTEPYSIESLRGTFEPEIGSKPIWDDLQNTSPALDALIEKIGSPTRVSIEQADVDKDKSMLWYSLIWENKDYVLEVALSEIYWLAEDYLSLGIQGIRYYTPEVWEHHKVYYSADSYNEYIIE